MILVADSGSTKCDWILISNSGERFETNSMGFNPFFHNEDLIAFELNQNELLKQNAAQITHIYFYGAGASSAMRNAIIERGLRRLFTNAEKIVVDHDVKAAVIATAKDNEGIVCILGTGSNSCYSDGNKIHEIIPALGYILGDEGSGSSFGKKTVIAYLYKTLPLELARALENDYGVNKELILETVYKKPNANVYLASFAKFVYDNRTHPFFEKIIRDGLKEFINMHVCCYDNYKVVPVHFIGSIAFYFKDVLAEISREYPFTIGQIVKNPITLLADYHSDKHSIPSH